jgi:hypothetical protein
MERMTGFGIAVVAMFITGVYGIRPKQSGGGFAPYQIMPPYLMLSEMIRAGTHRIVTNTQLET